MVTSDVHMICLVFQALCGSKRDASWGSAICEPCGRRNHLPLRCKTLHFPIGLPQ